MLVGLVRSVVSEHVLFIVIRQKMILFIELALFQILLTLKQLLAEQTQSFVDMIENVVQKVMSDSMQSNYFIVRAVQNSLIQDL